MDMEHVRALLELVRAGNITTDEAVKRLATLPFEDLGFAKVDHHRALRKGFPEVILGQGKTPEQIREIAAALAREGATVVVTRTDVTTWELLSRDHDQGRFVAEAGMIIINPPVEVSAGGKAAVVSAGTSDMPVALEAHETLRAMGCDSTLLQDVGIAGLHRLLGNLELLHSVDVCVVVAGMEGALPGVVSGLVSAPVIAVPTSVGYGASFGGLSALLAMLNGCSSGVTVVNIDNGFGAGYAAAAMLKRIMA